MQACYGHTEGAAGLTGVFLATEALRHAGAPGIMCLRELNPYVAAALADWRGRSGCSPQLPQASTLHCAPSLAGEGLCVCEIYRLACSRGYHRPCPAAGTSSFGMSGVNAHMLVGCSLASAAAPPAPVLQWQHQRYWPGPMLHHLAHPSVMAAPGGSTM